MRATKGAWQSLLVGQQPIDGMYDKLFIMEIVALAVGPLETNCYIVYENQKAIVVDPGGDADQIIAQISEKNLEVEYIFNTHGHHDHIIANKDISVYAKKAVYVHPDDEYLLSAGFPFWGIPASEKDYETKPVAGGDQFSFGPYQIEVIHTPGHTKGSVSYLIDGSLFCGDLLFKNSIGRSDFEESSPKDMVSSLKKVLELSDLTAVYPGHGAPTSIAAEKENNPFLSELNI